MPSVFKMVAPQDIETKSRILDTAHDLFYKYGIRSVSMDDIAHSLSISKKTIYRWFNEKEEIVHACCTGDLEEHYRNCEEINRNSRDAVHEIIGIMNFLSEMFSRMNPNLFYDLKKYHPHSYKAFRNFKEKKLLPMVEENLKRGVMEGLYREDINIKILSRLRIEQVELGLNAEIFPPSKYNYPEVQIALIDHFLHGIVTIKGMKLIDKYKEKII